MPDAKTFRSLLLVALAALPLLCVRVPARPGAHGTLAAAGAAAPPGQLTTSGKGDR